MLFDNVTINLKAGDGGHGAISFRREKYVSHGGPDGGDGGNGGNIIFKIDEGQNTLTYYKYKRKFKAENGGDGSGSKYHGKNGADLVLPVPPGTVIKDSATGLVIQDMSECDTFVICKGGRGGWGNRHFATPTRQIPRFAKPGLIGEEKEIILELKMIADVGLIGFPNVGKSSILSMISSARPKIADYHFTTLAPNIGVVSVGDERGFVAADIPGLIEGAAEGIGLGHAFLRHVDRCRLLLHVVDISGSEGRDPIDDIIAINSELERYSPELAKRPQIIIANKYDLLLEDADLTDFKEFAEVRGSEVIYVSAAMNMGIKELVDKTFTALQTLPPVKIFEAEYTAPELPEDTGSHEFSIYREDDLFIVEGDWLRRVMSSVNFSDRESLMYFQRVLKNSGVIKALEEAGVSDGDTVSIYDFEFDYVR
ncbi:MAG: GTPase ObgE [Clostridia bacterium]|nr:GTPase ObgE [Clostridia bacterium]